MVPQYFGFGHMADKHAVSGAYRCQRATIQRNRYPHKSDYTVNQFPHSTSSTSVFRQIRLIATSHALSAYLATPYYWRFAFLIPSMIHNVFVTSTDSSAEGMRSSRSPAMRFMIRPSSLRYLQGSLHDKVVLVPVSSRSLFDLSRKTVSVQRLFLRLYGLEGHRGRRVDGDAFAGVRVPD